MQKSVQKWIWKMVVFAPGGGPLTVEITISEFGSHEILGIAHSAIGPEAVFGLAGTSIEQKGTRPTKANGNNKTYR